MAARLDPKNIQPMRQSLHHLVAKAPWSDEVLLEQVRNYVLPTMQKQGPVVAWIVDDTGFPKKGKHSVGVTRQYCGQVGKQENCRIAVSLSVATWSSSLPIGYRLYLPKEWAEDAERREKAEVPEEVEFQTKPDIALDQIRAAVAEKVAHGVVLADAAYGINTEFRDGLTGLGLQYVVGVQSSMTVWEPGKQPLPAKPRGKMGRPPRLLQRTTDHQPVSVRQLAMSLPSTAFQEITWREGTDRKLRSRFAAVRVRAAHRDYQKAEPHAEEWLLIEWPRGEAEPTKYWMSTLPPNTRLKSLIKMAKHRWIIERDYEELKQELGLGHFEGRNWRGFHHHATLCIAAYGFLVAEREPFFPLCPRRSSWIHCPRAIPGLPPARVTGSAPSGIIRTRSRRYALFWRACCCGNCLTAPTADLLPAEGRSRNQFHRCTFAAGSAAQCATLPRATRLD
jgi:SRSO17 transposase